MQMFAYRNTERSIRARNSILREAKEKTRLQIQRELYEAKLEEAQHIATIKQQSADRAAALAAAMLENGYKYQHTYREIERRACKLFHVTQREIRADRKHASIAFVRQFIVYWTVRLTKLSLPQIGRLMGGKDHTTCIHSKRVYPEKRGKMGRYLREAR